jgi:hypothetical protein
MRTLFYRFLLPLAVLGAMATFATQEASPSAAAEGLFLGELSAAAEGLAS